MIKTMSNQVYIGVGSNLDNPLQQIETAASFLGSLACANTFRLSPIYISSPMGPTDQPDFHNAVSYIETRLEPLALLDALQEQEQKQGRKKERHWGERSIDLDILLFNQDTLDKPELVIPHVGLLERLFVLMPLSDLAPDQLLSTGKSVLTHLKSVVI